MWPRDQKKGSTQMPDLPASLLVNVVDGTRQPLVTDKKLLVRVVDGNQKEQSADFHNGPVIRFNDLPVFDNFGDNSTVIASTDGYLQAGFPPIPIKRGVLQIINLMLLPRDANFNFAQARWARSFPRRSRKFSNSSPTICRRQCGAAV